MKGSETDWSVAEKTPSHLARGDGVCGHGIRPRRSHVHEVPHHDGLVAIIEIKARVGPCGVLRAQVANPLQMKLGSQFLGGGGGAFGIRPPSRPVAGKNEHGQKQKKTCWVSHYSKLCTTKEPVKDKPACTLTNSGGRLRLKGYCSVLLNGCLQGRIWA
jgi:hypothetical protein